MPDSTATVRPATGGPPAHGTLVDVPRLVSAYYTGVPDAGVPAQRVAFGTSGHRGSSFTNTFNEQHVLAIAEAVCRHRVREGTDGPLFLGLDTHALSAPACASALEVLAAHDVHVRLAERDEYTPTPAVSLAILAHNRGRTTGLADGIVMTPSHNPPEDGGFKYDPPHGGPAGTTVTAWIEAEANRILAAGPGAVKRVPLARALRAAATRRYDFREAYVRELGAVLDLDAIRGARLHLGVDPMGGAGVHYWAAIGERYGLDLTVVSDVVDPAFGFMPPDADGRIRMDPSSPSAMRRLIGLRDRFDVAFACDTDHDRHGIVTPRAGLLPANHYLAAAIDHLFRHRPGWAPGAAVGKSVVTSALVDRVATRLGRPVLEVPVGFKWFVDGLLAGSLGFAGEESAGASFLRRDGTVWTTDKDGIVAALLAAEMTAVAGRDPGESYRELTGALGAPCEVRVEAPVTPGQKRALLALMPDRVGATQLAGEPVRLTLTRAPGDDEPIGGVKVIAESGWFAVRPSGTEALYRLYAESFRGPDHLRRIVEEAQRIVANVLGSGGGGHDETPGDGRKDAS